MPFSFNPFSKQKVDFLKDIKVEPELARKKEYAGAEDEKRIQQLNSETKPSVTERTIIRETPAEPGPPDL
jgi:hypothetical protein